MLQSFYATKIIFFAAYASSLYLNTYLMISKLKVESDLTFAFQVTLLE